MTRKADRLREQLAVLKETLAAEGKAERRARRERVRKAAIAAAKKRRVLGTGERSDAIANALLEEEFNKLAAHRLGAGTSKPGHDSNEGAGRTAEGPSEDTETRRG